MNAEAEAEARPLTILLSREELLAVLESLGVEFIPGLDPDPLGDLTPEGRELALIVARRALQARELAQLDSSETWLLHRFLLNAIGVCAYSQSALLAYHWPTGSETPSPFYGHLRGNDAVSHTKPAEVLHRFTVHASKDALLLSLLDFCDFAGEAPVSVEFALEPNVLARARMLAIDNVSAAVAALEESGVEANPSRALAATLAAGPRVSAIQTLKQMADGAAESHELTLVQHSVMAWWLIPATDGRLKVSLVGREQVRKHLAVWF